MFSMTTLVLAAVGGALRAAELTSAFDAKTGLASFSPLTVALIAVSLLAAAFYVFFSRKTALERIPGDYAAAFRPASSLPLLLSVLTLLMMFFGAYFCCLLGLENIAPAASGILALLAALSGIAGLVLNLNAYKKNSRGGTMFFAFADVIFLCYWTIVYYRQQAANPVLIDGMYAFLGLCSSALALFYIVGFAAGRPSPRSALLFSGAGIYFCALAILNASCLAYGLFFAVLIIRLYTACVLLLRNTGAEASGK